MGESFVGTIKPFAFDFPFRCGWQTCEGQVISTNDNCTLYSLIGNKFGGDARKGTFALPDLRDKLGPHRTSASYYICMNGIFPSKP